MPLTGPIMGPEAERAKSRLDPFTPLHHLINTRPAMRYLIQAFVNQPIQPLIFETIYVSPECPLAYHQQSGRLVLRQLPFLPSIIRFLEPHYPHLL
jgi:hypothetical protein